MNKDIKEKETETKPETVEVEKADLVELRKELEKLKSDRDILMATADKKSLATYYLRNKEKAPSIVRIRMIDGKAIVGWRTVEDLGSYQIPGTSKWTEKQTLELVFEDGTKREIDYMDFVRKYTTIKAETMSTTEDEATGSMVFRVIRQDNGQELKIESTYVN